MPGGVVLSVEGGLEGGDVAGEAGHGVNEGGWWWSRTRARRGGTVGACFGRGLSGVWRKLTDLDRTTTDASCSLSRASTSIVVAVVSAWPAMAHGDMSFFSRPPSAAVKISAPPSDEPPSPKPAARKGSSFSAAARNPPNMPVLDTPQRQCRNILIYGCVFVPSTDRSHPDIA